MRTSLVACSSRKSETAEEEPAAEASADADEKPAKAKKEKK